MGDQFLCDEENENEQDEEQKKEQQIEDEDDDKMDVDDDENDDDNEEKNAMLVVEDETNKEEMPANVYIAEHTFLFLMLSENQLLDINLSQIDAEIADIRASLSSMSVNMGAIDAYRKKDGDYMKRLQDLQNCKKNRDDVRREYEECKTARFDSFMSGFSQITKKLKEMYRMLTCGGDAELELVDSIDPFSEGVQFSVRPPKKSLKNVSIVANYIHQRTKNAQFVIISLRNNMFELANRLVGIYKTNNASKSITIDPKLFKLPTPSSLNQQQNVQSVHSSNHNKKNNDDQKEEEEVESNDQNNNNNNDMIDID